MGEHRRVLQLCPDFPPALGGISDYARRLCEQLSQLDFDVRVLTSVRSKDQSPEGFAMAATIEHWDERLWRDVAAEVAAFHPDVLHIQYQEHMYGGSPAIGWVPWNLLFRRIRPPVVTTLHDMTPPSRPPRWRGRFAFEALLYGSDRIVVSGEAEARGLAKRPSLNRRSSVGWIGSNVGIHSMPADRKAAVRAAFSRKRDGFLLLTFGLIRPGKGIEVLLESVAYLLRRDIAVELLIIGDIGDADLEARGMYRDRLQVLCRTLGLESSVQFLGHLTEEQVSELLQTADLGVLPFEHGASAGHTTVVAALSHGLPLVTTKGPGTPAVLENGSVALIDAPPDVGRLAKAIEDLIRDPDRRAAIGRRGRELNASQPTLGAQMAGIYETVIRRRSG